MTNRVHIGFFVSSLSELGGAIRVATSLANRMCKDYDVTVIERFPHTECAFPLDESVQVASLEIEAARFREQFVAVRKPLASVLKEQKISLLFGICVEESAMSILPCRAAKIPLVCCDHGALVNQLDDKTTTLLRRICARFADYLVLLTNQTSQDYARMFNTPKEKLFVIPNWISNQMLNAKDCDVSAKRILWAGRLDPEKGVDLLVEIGKRVLPTHQEWTWDIYGTAVLESKGFDLKSSIEKAGLEGNIRLCGTYENTQGVFPNYSIGTLTSYREGLPLFLLETLAYAMPLVSFDVDTGPRDIIDHGKNGYLVKSYDCDEYASYLEKLIESEELRSQFSAASKTKAQDFSEEDIYQKWRYLISHARKEN
jgi:glycosyltransferase involved in cell wall biosynthesis